MKGLEIYKGHKAGPTTLLTTFLHGNEIVGNTVREHILQYLTTEDFIGTIILLEGNQAAKEANVRFLDSDLNRSFGENALLDREGKRAAEIKKYFEKNNIIPDYVYDIHSTSGPSDPMIICGSKDDVDHTRLFPIKKVLIDLMQKTDGKSMAQYFSEQLSTVLAFECGQHDDPACNIVGKEIVDAIRKAHNGKEGKKNEKQNTIKITHNIFTSDPDFTFLVPMNGFDIIPAGTAWGKDKQQEYSFDTDKIVVIPNTHIRTDIIEKGKEKTWVSYFGEKVK